MTPLADPHDGAVSTPPRLFSGDHRTKYSWNSTIDGSRSATCKQSISRRCCRHVRRSVPLTDRRSPDQQLSSNRFGRPRPLRGVALELAEQLHRAGFLTRPFPRRLPPDRLPAYLNADLGALFGRYGDDAAEVLARRRQAAVVV